MFATLKQFKKSLLGDMYTNWNTYGLKKLYEYLQYEYPQSLIDGVDCTLCRCYFTQTKSLREYKNHRYNIITKSNGFYILEII